MEDTQLFRLAGTSAVQKIPCDHVDDNSVVYWEDVEQVFPGIQHVMNGDVIVKLLRDSNRNRIVPHCIKHHPGVVLDVVISPSGGNGAAPGTNIKSDLSENDIVESLQITHPLSDTPSSHDTLRTPASASPLPSSSDETPRTSLSFKQVVKLVQKKAIESEFERRLVSSLPSDLQAKVLNSPSTHNTLVQAIRDGLVGRPNEQLAISLGQIRDEMARNNELASMNNQMAMKNTELTSGVLNLASENKELLARVQELRNDLTSNREETQRLQKQALDRLSLLQNSVQTLLTQTYELHDYPITRLFIVLPQDNSSWNPLDFFSNRFRLYFLCECGEHTKLINRKIPHHIHLAKHGGHDVDRPKEFFRHYGSHVLTVLRMLKFGISMPGVTIPALAHLIRPDATGHITGGLKKLTTTLEPGMNLVLEYLEKTSAGGSKTIVRFAEKMDKHDALEGPDLRRLETFLKSKERKKIHGNLYRTVTAEGHVKWVCIDHFREEHQEKAAKAFRDAVDAQGGLFQENIGRVDVVLYSRVEAEQFYVALRKAKSIYELKITLDWETAQSDFKSLRDTLSITSVGMLDLRLTDTDGPTTDLLNRSQRYDPVFDIMQHPSIKSFTIIAPQDFIKRSSLVSRDNNFSNLRRLHISVYDWEDCIFSLRCLMDKVTGVSSLEITANKNYILPVYYAVAEHQTCHIQFYDRHGQVRRIRPPLRKVRQSMDIHQYMAYFLKTYSKVDIQHLDKFVMSESDAMVITKGLNDIFLTDMDRFGDATFGSLASIVAQSELRDIDICVNGNERSIQVLESIQWKHLHNFVVRLKRGSLATSVMRALVDSVKKIPGRASLKQFQFHSDSEARLFEPLMPQGDLLHSFIASVSFEVLELAVVMTLDQILSMFRSLDVTRLRQLVLWAKGFDSVKVDAILDGLQHAKKLKVLVLVGASITNEQIDRAKAKGVSFGNVLAVPSVQYTRTDPRLPPGFRYVD